MAIPRAKAKGKKINTKTFDDARFYLSKQIFPGFLALVLMGVLDELDHGSMKNFHLTEGERERIVKAMAERVQHYCDLVTEGAIDPFEVRASFEKSTGMDFSKIYI